MRYVLCWSLCLICVGLLHPICSKAESTTASQSCQADDPTCSAPRVDCRDVDKRCSNWAELGECQKNKRWMSENCAVSCDTCPEEEIPIGDIPDDLDCTDKNPMCKEWSSLGECILNPVYMNSACRASCLQCVRVSSLRTEGLSDEEIRKVVRYSKTDWGVHQEYSTLQDAQKQELKPLLIAMQQYALNNGTSLPVPERKECKNHEIKCIQWAHAGECETNNDFMIRQCPLACQWCHELTQYKRCQEFSFSKGVDELLLPGELFSTYEFLSKKEEIELASTLPVGSQDDAWVLKYDGFLSEEESDELVQVIRNFKWVLSEIPFEDSKLGGNPVPVRRTSTSAFCELKGGRHACRDPIVLKVVDRISELMYAEKQHIETPIEFVHYNKMQSFGMHHDYRFRDSWLPAGPRVFGIFVCLSAVEEGGAMGFPDLNWLSIPPRKGQLLVWPNVLSSHPSKKAPKMSCESLPVISGEKYGLLIWVHLHNYHEAKEMACV